MGYPARERPADPHVHPRGLAEGEDTDRERLFTVARVACLGCCMLAPAVEIEGHIYGFVEPGTVGALLDDFLRGARGGATLPDASTGAGPASTGEIRTCLCTSCRSSGSGEILREAAAAVKSLRLPATLREVACTGASWESPRIEVSLPAGGSFRYGRVKPDDVRRILLRHFTPAGPGRRLAASLSALVDQLDGEESVNPPTRYLPDARPDFRPAPA